MNLLAPGFLYALAALAIPVIIHLFQFRKVRRVYFSNTRFLEQVKQVSQTKRRLKHLLVLLCRLGFLLFLILTFARPYIPGPHQAEARLVDIYLDNSYSMTNDVEEGLTAFEAAIRYANGILTNYPKGTKFRLLTNGFESSEQYYYSAEIISDKLTELQLAGRSRNLEEVLERLSVRSNVEEQSQRDVFLISDMQRSSWPQNLNGLAADSTNRYFLVPLQYEQHRNLYVDSVYLDKPYYLPNIQNTLQVRVTNTGTSTADVPLKLTVNGRQIATSTVTVPANGKELVSFPLNFSIDKLNRAKLELVDYPINFDNEFYFVLRKGDPVNILELTQDNASTPVSRVFADSSLFRLRSREAGNFNFSELGWADLVVVNSLEQPSSSILTALQEYTAAGGTLVYIPHPQAAGGTADRITERVAVQPVQAESTVRLAPPNVDNPFFEGIFEENNARFTTPQARPVISWAGRANNILMLQTGSPFAGEIGNVWLFASPLTDDYTNFHRHALFVPVMYKIAFESKSVTNPLYFNTQESVFNVQVGEQTQNRVYRLEREEAEIIPAQQYNNRSLLLDVPAYTLQPGFYSLTAEDSVEQLLAFNHAEEESIPEQVGIEVLNASAEELPHVEVLNDAVSAGEGNEMQANFGAVMLWKWTLLLALLFLLCEVLLIRFWK
ncbi:BatA domain-containing protein [Cesiribacter sp. SM1]|uniref:BatA domain-containing protein n=1 Tax=Cesiribacter sp. SM1 TaxID=2861196 RepID=UPI001CD38B9C|nr:BatA domain-containing protein [Cesiribacter sp. SM1]